MSRDPEQSSSEIQTESTNPELKKSLITNGDASNTSNVAFILIPQGGLIPSNTTIYSTVITVFNHILPLFGTSPNVLVSQPNLFLSPASLMPVSLPLLPVKKSPKPDDAKRSKISKREVTDTSDLSQENPDLGMKDQPEEPTIKSEELPAGDRVQFLDYDGINGEDGGDEEPEVEVEDGGDVEPEVEVEVAPVRPNSGDGEAQEQPDWKEVKKSPVQKKRSSAAVKKLGGKAKGFRQLRFLTNSTKTESSDASKASFECRCVDRTNPDKPPVFVPVPMVIVKKYTRVDLNDPEILVLENHDQAGVRDVRQTEADQPNQAGFEATDSRTKEMIDIYD